MNPKHSLSAGELAKLKLTPEHDGGGNELHNVEQELTWLLSFINLGKWWTIEAHKGYSASVFDSSLRKPEPARAVRLKLIDQINAFCRTGKLENSIDWDETLKLHELAARILHAVAAKGVVMENLPECGMILSVDRKGKALSANVVGDPNAHSTRFILNLRDILQVIDLPRLRKCRGCDKVFYGKRGQHHCEKRCANRTRQKRKYYRDRSLVTKTQQKLRTKRS